MLLLKSSTPVHQWQLSTHLLHWHLQPQHTHRLLALVAVVQRHLHQLPWHQHTAIQHHSLSPVLVVVDVVAVAVTAEAVVAIATLEIFAELQP